MIFTNNVHSECQYSVVDVNVNCKDYCQPFHVWLRQMYTMKPEVECQNKKYNFYVIIPDLNINM
jgi:hypothetical protein